MRSRFVCRYGPGDRSWWSPAAVKQRELVVEKLAAMAARLEEAIARADEHRRSLRGRGLLEGRRSPEAYAILADEGVHVPAPLPARPIPTLFEVGAALDELYELCEKGGSS